MKIYLPDSVYRWMPTVYAVAGGTLAAWFPDGIGKPSAMLLLFIGIALFNMRINNLERQYEWFRLSYEMAKKEREREKHQGN